MKKLIVVVFFAYVIASVGAEYTLLLEAVEKCQIGYSDQDAVDIILKVARSEDYEEVVTRCMGIYTLQMGAKGDAGRCQSGFQSVCNRYPDSDVVRQLRELSIFPSPCPACKGIGVVQKISVSECSSCRNSGSCRRCNGTGTVKGKNIGLMGRRRVGLWKTKRNIYDRYGHRSVIYDYGQNENNSPSDNRRDIKCPVCKGRGVCTSCKGSPNKERLVNVKCPTCNGVSKGINISAARAGLIRLCQDTKEMLQKAVDCENAYIEAMLIEEPHKQLELLNSCIAKYDGAFNLSMVYEARDDLNKQCAQEKRDRFDRAKEVVAEKQKKAKEVSLTKRQTYEAHKDALRWISGTTCNYAALLEITRFLEENPDTPLIVEAQLLKGSLENKMAAERKAAKRKRNLLMGCGGVACLIFLWWLVSAVKSKRPAEVQIPVMSEIEPEQRKIPFRPSEPLSAGSIQKSRLRVLFEASSNTPEDNVVSCPECGALVDSPPEVQEEDVVCSVCQKAFHVH